jgi:hypothetical protein
MSETYLYSINRVINIDNGTDAKKTVFAIDAEQIYKNLIDTKVTSQCRIIGGTWTDNLVVNNILCHPSDEDDTYINGQTNNILNIASDGNVVNMQGSNINITSVEADSITNINGKTLNMGENEVSDTAVNLYGKTINMGENDSITTIKNNQITITTADQDSTTTINGKTLNMGENEVSGTAVNLYGKTINMGENDSITTIKNNQITITTAGQDSTTTINGKTLNMGENEVSGTAVTLYGKNITMGEQDTITTLHSDTIKFNDNTDGTRVLIEDGKDGDNKYNTSGATFNNSPVKYGALIEIGNGVKDTSQDTTAHINLQASKITIDAEDILNLSTKAFGLGSPSDPAYFELNNNTSNIQIGATGLETLTMHGSNIRIGENNGTVKIFGNVEMYSEGSNIVTNTNIETTSAFEINNTGTKTALTVVQTNEVSSENYNLCEFFCSDNQDRTPFRIDAFGRVGMGVKKYQVDGTTKRELKAWLHVYKNSPNDLDGRAGILNADDVDIFLVEDSLESTVYNNDNPYDGTPFVIKNKGDVGIGTYIPRYKLDVWSTNSALNGQANSSGIIGNKGIAFRDVVYIKQNHTNRIMYALGNKLYIHPAGDFTHSCVTGFTFTWNKNDVAYANSDNTGVDPLSPPNTDGTFVFRMTCKLHIAGNDGHIAFRRFEIFVNPQDNLNDFSKEMPAHVTIADMFDSAYDHYEFPVEPLVKRISNETCQLQIKWKLRNATGGTTMPTSSRAYLDVEFFGHENIGDVKAEPLNAYDIVNDGTLTPV